MFLDVVRLRWGEAKGRNKRILIKVGCVIGLRNSRTKHGKRRARQNTNGLVQTANTTSIKDRRR